MPKISNLSGHWLMIRSAQLAALSAIALLSACAVQERVYVPAPRVYAPPPPPPPAVEVEAGGGGVEITASEPPPPLPDYEQPPCPEDGYLWTPGYWNYGAGGYYWVPGTWVQPPTVGFLWTPGYWGFAGGVYGFHAGYWGPHVGFYGGVNYGFGYGGVGFRGGRWEGGRFAYNTAVNNVNVTVIHNTYNQTVINNNVTVNRVSYNGGAAGVRAAPTPAGALLRAGAAHSADDRSGAAHPNGEQQSRARGAHQRGPPGRCGNREAGRIQRPRSRGCARCCADERLADETGRTGVSNSFGRRNASTKAPPVRRPHTATPLRSRGRRTSTIRLQTAGGSAECVPSDPSRSGERLSSPPPAGNAANPAMRAPAPNVKAPPPKAPPPKAPPKNPNEKEKEK